MSRRLHTPKRRSDQDPVLPLINVVFLLLIVFMIAGQLTAPTPFPVTPPTAADGEDSPDRPGVIHVSASGEFAMAGARMSEAELAMAAADTDAAATPEPWQVVADADAPAVTVARLIGILRTGGERPIHLITTRR